MLCYCGGDIDDLLFGDDSEEAIACTHYRERSCDGRDDFLEDGEDVA